MVGFLQCVSIGVTAPDYSNTGKRRKLLQNNGLCFFVSRQPGYPHVRTPTDLCCMPTVWQTMGYVG